MALKTPAIPQMNAGQATYVIQKLVESRKVSYNDLVRYLADMSREIRDLETRLASLRSAQGAGAAPPAAAAVPRAGRGRKAAAPKRMKTPITKAQLASRRLQGQYLGLLIQFPKEKRAQYQKLSKEKGREAAIAKMRSDMNR